MKPKTITEKDDRPTNRNTAIETLKYELNALCQQHPDGSLKTQQERHRLLETILDLTKHQNPQPTTLLDLTPETFYLATLQWNKEGSSWGSIKNRIVYLRWLAEKLDKPNLVAKSNNWYRELISFISFATGPGEPIDATKLIQIPDATTRIVLQCQAAFGMTCHEVLQLSPSAICHDSFIQFTGSKNKGSIVRSIPLVHQWQRDILDQLTARAGDKPLALTRFEAHDDAKIMEAASREVGLRYVDQLRACYAQRRYFELTGKPAPSFMQMVTTYKEWLATSEHNNAEIQILMEMGLQTQKAVHRLIGTHRSFKC